MGETLSFWLRMRESADAAARSERLSLAVAAALPLDSPLHVLDLGTGTGSNIRYLVERLPPAQRWLAVDRDATLLTELVERMLSWADTRGYDARRDVTGCLIRGERLECRIETRQMDLGDLDDDGIFAGRHLVTAAALLDLVSARWLKRLADRCRSTGTSALFAITYNGRSACEPVEPEDDLVRGLLNRHQKRHQGLAGHAEGPDAALSAEQIFSAAGFHVYREASDWILDPGDEDLQRGLVEAWAEAAIEMSPDRRSTIADWRVRRLAHITSGRSRIVVGHDDLAALLR